MYLAVLVLIIILIFMFRDTIVKLVKNNNTKYLDSEKVISKEYKIDNLKNKKIKIDVHDTNIKILSDESLSEINIITNYLIEKLKYDVVYGEDFINISRNNGEVEKIGNSGKVLIKLPKRSMIDDLKIESLNGDIEFYDVNVDNLIIKNDNGLVKIESLNGKTLDINKLSGDVCFQHLNLTSLNLNVEKGNVNFSDVYGENICVNVENGDFIFVNVFNEDYKIEALKFNTLNGKQKINVNANIIN